MKIVCLHGSPRKNSNSSKVAQFLCGFAKDSDNVITYNLNELSYKGCQGCYACKKTKDKCVLNDDLSEVLKNVSDCDILIMSSPVYYGDVTAQLKGFIDRTFSYLVPDYPTNKNKTRLIGTKKVVFCITQGHPNKDLFADIFPKYRDFFKWLGFAESHLIRFCDVDPTDDVSQNRLILDEVKMLSKNIFV